jgi:hypothetical protein
VNRKRVTSEEYAFAAEIIVAFNEAAGTKLTPEKHLTPVVGRIREMPDLTARDHRGIIAACFAVPWWSGAPGPGVIYGNAEQFERSIETWRATPKAKLRVVEPPIDPAEYAAGAEAARAAWPKIAARLEASVPESTFRLWIGPLQAVGAAGDTLYLAAEDGIRAWAERRYSALITEAMSECGVPWGKVSFAGTLPDDNDQTQAA